MGDERGGDRKKKNKRIEHYESYSLSHSGLYYPVKHCPASVNQLLHSC